MSGATPTAPPAATPQQSPYAVRKIDLTFQLGAGSFNNTGQNQLTVTGLRVHAHLEAIVSPHMASVAIIRVYGMTLDHMNTLSKAGLLYAAPNTSGGAQNKIQVRAGDASSGMTTVFNGTIIEAYPDFDGGADDRHFYIYATPSAPIQLKPVPPTSYPGSVQASQVFQTLAQSVGYTLQNNGVKAVLASPYLPGTVWQQIRATVRAADCFAYFDAVNQVLRIWPKIQATAPNPTVTIGPQTGMISYPKFEAAQIIVRTEFNPSLTISPGTSVIVQSQLKAANNAKLIVNMITHELSSQLVGGPWETIVIGTPMLSS